MMTDFNFEAAATYDWFCEGCGALGHDKESADEHRETCGIARYATTQIWFAVRDL